jgi:site-specific recombinase XerD
MDAMPRPRPPHLHRETNRHGKTVWFVRVGHGPRVRIRAAQGSPEFQAEYQAALGGSAIVAPRKSGAGTLGWLWDRYRETQVWAKLSPATRRQRENIMRPVLEMSGKMPLSDMTRKTVVAGRDRRASTPAMARHFVDTLHGLFQWAVDAEHVAVDPTERVKVEKPQTEGFAVWTNEEVERFRVAYPLGTRERVAFDLLYYTGLRRGDVARVGRQHVRDGVLMLSTAKTGEKVSIRILSELATTLAAGPCGDLTFIVSERTGRAFTKESFGNWFREVCTAAGCTGSAHGLRKALATRLANEGATVHELEALFGWRGGGMAALYTRTADRTRLAGSAMDRLIKRTSIPAPNGKVRE